MRFPWNRAESELEQEIAHHLHELAAEYERQGHSRAEAMRMAKREFGGSEQVKEYCRDERRWAWMAGLWQDVTFGLRIMRRTPIVTIAAILSLALGIGANTAIVSLMDVVLWRDLPVPNPQQLSLVNWQGQGFPRELADGAAGSMLRSEEGGSVANFFSYPGFRAMRDSAGGMASLAAYVHSGAVSVSYEGRPSVAELRAVSGNFFSTLQTKPAIGRLLSESDDDGAASAAVVVTHRFWEEALGGDDRVAGRTIRINNQPCIVVGVLEPRFYGLVPGDGTELYASIRHGARLLDPDSGDKRLFDNRFWGVSLIARRAPNATAAQLQTALQSAFSGSWSAQPKDASRAPRVRLDDGGRGLGFLRREFRNPLLVLGGLVTLLLVIACTNIANLLLARAAARQKEVAMRISLGCSQARLMRQFFTESGLLAGAGGAASIAVSYLTANLLGGFLQGRNRIPVEITLDLRMLATAFATTVLALLIFGVFPAWRGSRMLDAAWLKQGGGSMVHASRRKWNTGRVLVLAQVAMSVVLVLTAVIFTRNLLAIESADPGFDRRNLIVFETRPGASGYAKKQLPGFYFNLERRLAAVPGVSGAGLASMRPMNIGGWWDTVALAGETERHSASINGVTPEYLPIFAAQMVAGRNLTRADVAGEAKVAVISEDLARKLGGTSVLGRLLAFVDGPPNASKPTFEIVGIAPAMAVTSMKERPYAVWLPFESERSDATVVLRTARPPAEVLPMIRQAIAEIDRNLPMVDVFTMEDQIAKSLQRERMFATLCNGFGILALTLAVVGLYGVMAFSTTRRRGEIGVRLALGALPGDVLALVLRDGFGLVLLGMMLSIPIVWVGARYVEKELFQMKPLDPASLAPALLLLLVAALVAVGIPALRASRVQPVQTLRQE